MRKDTCLFLAASAVAVIGAIWMSAPPKPPASPSPAPAGAIPAIAPAEAKKRLGGREKIVLLDVRTPEEYAEQHIPGSLLLPLADPGIFGLGAGKAIPDRNAVVFVYCRSGRRSQIAAEILAGIGYRNVYNLGGIVDWPYEKEGKR